MVCKLKCSVIACADRSMTHASIRKSNTVRTWLSCILVCGAVSGLVLAAPANTATAWKGGSIKLAGGAEISRITGNAEPFLELWDEGGFHGTLDVAMDGTVLIFMVLGGEEGDGIYVKRSEDGGATWSDRQFIGKHVELDWKALGIGPYDGKGWGRDRGFRHASLGTSVVDENTGEIMLFMTALHPAPYMYKSRDNGKTWKLEKVELKKVHPTSAYLAW